MESPKKDIRKRIKVFVFLFACAFAALIIRCGYLQTVKASWLTKQATLQQTRDQKISPKRGVIYDRNGKELAVSASVEKISASPAQIKESEQSEMIAEKLAEALEMDYESVHKKITQNTSYVTLKRRVEKDVSDKIRALKNDDETAKAFEGVYIEEDTKRYYPYGNFASHVIGFTGSDDQGLYGIENYYDDVLSGTAGRVISVKNAAGTGMSFKYEQKYDSEDGMNLVLTIDETIQHFAEKHLEQAVLENKPNQGAVAMVMNPKTAEIYALAVKPDYDLNAPFTITNEETLKEIDALQDKEKEEATSAALMKMWRNKAVSDTYEPGSVFKILTASMALEEGVANVNSRFNCSGGMSVGGFVIHCWKTAGHGGESFKEGLQNSCNPVFMTLGLALGPERFFKYFEDFGLTQKSGIDLNGEGKSVYYDASALNASELATSSFGQSFQVTPIQLITAVSAAINGGKLMEPHLVKAITDKDGNVVKSIEPKVRRQVVSEETSAIIRDCMQGVVDIGTGKSARIQGYAIGGKTGTSEKQPRNHGLYVASFLGMAPADDPEIVCLVVIDEPTGLLYQGSQISAPVARNIMEDTLNYLEIEKNETEEVVKTTVPEVRNLTVEEARSILAQQNFAVTVKGDGGIVNQQIPRPGASAEIGSNVIIYLEGTEVEQIEVPDLSGMSMKDAWYTLNNLGLLMTYSGSEEGSIVTSQIPKAGVVTEPMSTVKVELTYMNGD